MLRRLIAWLREPMPEKRYERAVANCVRDGHDVSDDDRRDGCRAGAVTGQPIRVCCRRCGEYIDLGTYMHDLFDRQAIRQWEARMRTKGRA